MDIDEIDDEVVISRRRSSGFASYNKDEGQASNLTRRRYDFPDVDMFSNSQQLSHLEISKLSGLGQYPIPGSNILTPDHQMTSEQGITPETRFNASELSKMSLSKQMLLAIPYNLDQK